MAKIKGTVVIDTEECKGCGLCIGACPQHVLELSNDVNNKGYHFSFMKNPDKFMKDPDECIGCSNCATVCPDACISVYRLKI